MTRRHWDEHAQGYCTGLAFATIFTGAWRLLWVAALYAVIMLLWDSLADERRAKETEDR